MSDVLPILPTLADPPRRDRQIVATAAMSVILHLLLLGWVLLPRVQPAEPTEPQSVNVELVPPSELSSVPPPVSSEAPSSALPSALSELSSEQPSSSEPASSELTSSAAASSAAAASEVASSAEQSSVAASEPPASPPPVPRGRPVVIPLGPSQAPSAETSSREDSSDGSSEAASASAEHGESPSLLTADQPAGSDAAGSPAPADGPPPPTGALHAAKQFYLEAMLAAPTMASARKALKTLPPEKRLAQTCNIEAIAQLGNAGRGYEPNALIANAFAQPVITGTAYSVSNGAFRSKQKWVAVAYECTLSDKLDAVSSFTFRIGSDVTDAMLARFGAPKPAGSKPPQ